MKSHPSEFAYLINRLLDETITAEEHARLCEFLRGNPSAIKEYLFCIDVHASIIDLEGRSEEEVTAGFPGVPLPASTRESGYMPQRKTRQLPLWVMWALAPLATVILILLASYSLQRAVEPWRVVATKLPERVNASSASSPSQPDGIAVKSAVFLSQAAHAELFFEKTPGVGDAIQLGHEYVLAKGLMELSFENGASAVLQSPAIFTVVNPERIELKIGRCSVHAGHSAAGFEVVTPQGRVVDLGTRFSVVASEVGVSDIQVIEGAVEYHPKTAGSASSMLLEGEAVRLPDISQDSESIPFNREEYQSEFPDRVVAYHAVPGPEGKGVRDLVSVTVQRGGTIKTYPVEELIGIDILHFSAYSKQNSVCSAGPPPDQVDQLLSESVALNSGITNFDRDPEPYQPAKEFKNFRERYGLAVQFRQPVKNEPGPDLVLFELQSAAYPPGGDPFYVSPIEDLPGLKTHHVQQFDITMHSANALPVASLYTHLYEQSPHSLEQLLNLKVIRSSRLHVPFHAIAVGIDFSDLGYSDGASVPGIFVEDASDDDFIAIDVVFIGGLPPK